MVLKGIRPYSKQRRTVEHMQQASGEPVEQQQSNLHHSDTFVVLVILSAGLRNYNSTADDG